MAKAIPTHSASQGTRDLSTARADLLGSSFPTGECGYSIVQGMVFDHLADDVWLPGDPLLLNFEVDYRPLVRSIRRCRRLLLREQRQTISPRGKREIRSQREILASAQAYFELATELGDRPREGVAR